jgi:hypothetical protein
VLVDQTEARLWLTRRLVLVVANGMADLLVKTRPKEKELPIPQLSDTISKAKLAADFAKAKENPSDAPAPPPPQAPVPSNLPVGVCQSLDISPGDKVWSFVWRVPGTPGYLLTLDRGAAMRLTAGLLAQAKNVGWNLPEDIEKKLLDPSTEP